MMVVPIFINSHFSSPRRIGASAKPSPAWSHPEVGTGIQRLRRNHLFTFTFHFKRLRFSGTRFEAPGVNGLLRSRKAPRLKLQQVLDFTLQGSTKFVQNTSAVSTGALVVE